MKYILKSKVLLKLKALYPKLERVTDTGAALKGKFLFLLFLFDLRL